MVDRNRDFFVMFSHTDKELKKTLDIFEEVFALFAICINSGFDVSKKIKGRIDKSLFV